MTQHVKFGLNVDPNTGGLPIAERITAIADDSGLDLVGVQDHPYNDGFTDTLALITWLAARTRHVHLFPNVANLPLRPPAMLAKQAATIDVLSDGRFELGLGAGAFADGITGMGGPRHSPGQARGALSEAIDIIRASWARRTLQLPGLLLPSTRCPAGSQARPRHRPVARRHRPACSPTRRRQSRRLVSIRTLRATRPAARAQPDHHQRRPRRRPRPSRDYPPVQRHGPDHPAGPGRIQRTRRTLGRNPHHLAHRFTDERVRILAHRRPGTAIPPVR